MLYKTMILVGILIGSILTIENYVLGYTAVVIIAYTKSGTLVIASMIVGAMIGYGVKGFMDKTDYNEDDDFNY